MAKRSTSSTRKPATIRQCPVAAFQRMISGKYKLRIMWDLKEGPLRYGEIRTGLLRGLIGSPEIAPRILSRQLARERRDINEVEEVLAVERAGECELSAFRAPPGRRRGFAQHSRRRTDADQFHSNDWP